MENSVHDEFGVYKNYIPCDVCGHVTVTLDGVCDACRIVVVSMMDNDSMIEDHDLEGGEADNGR